MKHARWSPDEIVTRMRHDFAEAIIQLDDLEVAIREQLDALELLSA